MPLPKPPADAGFFGQSIAYPLTIERGRLALVSGDEIIPQAIASLLDTVPGERVMQPDYGAAVSLFEPPDPHVVQERLADQMRDHEPRGEIVNVDAQDQGDGRHDYVIEYRTIGEADTRTLTYPYFRGP